MIIWLLVSLSLLLSVICLLYTIQIDREFLAFAKHQRLCNQAQNKINFAHNVMFATMKPEVWSYEDHSNGEAHSGGETGETDIVPDSAGDQGSNG